MSRCTARWLYRGRTRAKCYGDSGHDGKHWNGTVKWTDATPGAIPALPEHPSCQACVMARLVGRPGCNLHLAGVP